MHARNIMILNLKNMAVKFGNWQEFLDNSLEQTIDNEKLSEFGKLSTFVDRIDYVNQHNLCECVSKRCALP